MNKISGKTLRLFRRLNKPMKKTNLQSTMPTIIEPVPQISSLLKSSSYHLRLITTYSKPSFGLKSRTDAV